MKIILSISIVFLFLFSCSTDEPELPSDKIITSFSFRAVDNPDIPGDVQGTITADEIHFTFAAGVPVISLRPTVVFDGSKLSPASGIAVDFSNPVTYTVTAQNKSTREYTVIVTVEPEILSTEKSLTSFSFQKADNPTLAEDISATISGQLIACTLPAGTSLTALKPTIGHTGNIVNPASGTANNFTSPVTYTIIAEDGSQADYTVTVSLSASGPVVYVAGGQIFSGTRYARVWTNGTGTSLSDGRFNSSCTSVFVSGNILHTAGNVMIGNSYASSWKIEDGIQLPTPRLNETSNDGYANSIFVSASDDIYIAGQEFYGGIGTIAKVWKNGTATPLTTKAGAAHSVFVSGADVYVAGWEETATETNAKVWKNGVATILGTEGQKSLARAVFVSGGVVYVAGQYWNGSTYIVQVWKNGVAEDIDPESIGSEPTSIFVDNGNVYVTGHQVVDGVYKAVLWKNGSGTLLLSSGASEAASVYVHEGDVYVAGWETNNDGKLVAMLWKNGEGTPLATDAFANSVFVK